MPQFVELAQHLSQPPAVTNKNAALLFAKKRKIDDTQPPSASRKRQKTATRF